MHLQQQRQANNLTNEDLESVGINDKTNKSILQPNILLSSSFLTNITASKNIPSNNEYTNRVTQVLQDGPSDHRRRISLVKESTLHKSPSVEDFNVSVSLLDSSKDYQLTKSVDKQCRKIPKLKTILLATPADGDENAIQDKFIMENALN